MPANAPIWIAILIGPGFPIDGVDGKDHGLTAFQPGSPGVGHAEVFKVEEPSVLAGNEQHRTARVAVYLHFHIAAQGRAVLLEILGLHGESLL